MPIYKGSTKLGTIYHGGTKIGKVYKGSTLVYSGSTKNIPIYNICDLNAQHAYYILGEPKPNIDINGTIISTGLGGFYNLKSITGNIGAAGSTLTVLQDGTTYNLTFYKSFTDGNGFTFYWYNTAPGFFTYVAALSPKQQVGGQGFVFISAKMQYQW